MRNVKAFIVALALCSGALAGTVKLTMYDDGLSCPAGCDAHVVFAPGMNGTEFAHAIGTQPPSYGKCTAGSACEICMESGGKQCMRAMYRGHGPHAMTFDLTPAFYEDACKDTAGLPLLRAKCDSLNAQSKLLSGRKNCIANPSDAQCKPLIASALEAQKLDRADYDKCIKMGEAAFNKAVPPSKRRALGCAYESVSTGVNSTGATWKKLLPGACRDGTFVGHDGLDCCSGSTFHDGPLLLECRQFYPKPASPVSAPPRRSSSRAT